ncbi:phage tail protein [Pseudoalteromonas rubra]|uniref:Phage tail collar domain-containing protein n=1 Tax=Pseudoalteromonas rubra TaxID=43658 RepID=A0A0U3HN04_9GAMM|nr:tail fiber protein [Pseudoalteromonas rubra]ALU44341.1 hypothetical protein AT705_16080 [Pseudoalteromonas rubra]
MAVDAFIGELMPFSGTFAVRNFTSCHGQLLSIAQFQAVFSIMGTYYGGDGRTSFGVADLRGRSPVSFGTGPGLSTYVPGQKTGLEQTTLTVNQMPSHTHVAQAAVTVQSAATATMTVAENAANLPGPVADSYLGKPQDQTYFSPSAFSPLSPVQIAGPEVEVTSNAAAEVHVLPAGNNSAIDIRSPVQAVSWQVCIYGTYPSRAD